MFVPALFDTERERGSTMQNAVWVGTATWRVNRSMLGGKWVGVRLFLHFYISV
jgi:hypothetical protein